MKKALPLLAILLVLAGVIIFTQRRTGGVGEKFPASRAAELAPASTVAFFNVPDVDRAVQRWKASTLGALAREPEWQAQGWQQSLATGLRARASEVYALGPLFRKFLGAVCEVDPAGLYIALTELKREDGSPPEIVVGPGLVAGLSYRGKKSDVEKVMRAQKDELLRNWGGGTSELSAHHGIEIESMKAPPWIYPWESPAQAKAPHRNIMGFFRDWGSCLRELHIAYRDNWIFIATDRPLLTETLDRYLRKADPGTSLAEDAIFVASRKQALPDADLVAWTRWGNFSREFFNTVAESPLVILVHNKSVFSLIAGAEDGVENPALALDYSALFDGLRVRDRLYFHFAKPTLASTLPSDAPALRSAAPYFHATANFGLLKGREREFHECFWDINDWGQTLQALADEGLQVNDVWAAFGPVVSLVSIKRVNQWTRTDGGWPEYLLAWEVRDARKAQRILDLTRKVNRGQEPNVNYMRQVVPWYPRSRNLPLPPTVLTKTHFFIGRTEDALANGVQNIEDGRTMPQGNAKPAVTPPIGAAPPNVARIELDARTFWESGLSTDTNTSSIGKDQGWMASQLGWTLRVDSKTMPVKAIARHLQPTVLEIRTEGQGWFIEGSGTAGLVGNYLFVKWALGGM